MRENAGARRACSWVRRRVAEPVTDRAADLADVCRLLAEGVGSLGDSVLRAFTGEVTDAAWRLPDLGVEFEEIREIEDLRFTALRFGEHRVHDDPARYPTPILRSERMLRLTSR